MLLTYLRTIHCTVRSEYDTIYLACIKNSLVATLLDGIEQKI